MPNGHLYEFQIDRKRPPIGGAMGSREPDMLGLALSGNEFIEEPSNCRSLGSNKPRPRILKASLTFRLSGESAVVDATGGASSTKDPKTAEDCLIR